MSVPLPTLVPRRRVAEVDERIDGDGRAFVPLDEAQARQAARGRVEEEGVESLAICLLWSFRNPAHERRVAALARADHPALHVACSAELFPVIREYERMTTRVLNAYTWRNFSTFLDAVEARVAGAGLRVPVAVVQSNGGTMAAAGARAKPVVLAQSGEGAVRQPGAPYRPARRVLLLALLLAGCVGRGPRGGLGALTTKLDAFVAAHPLAASQALRIDRIDRTDTASYHVVQARGSEASHRHATHDLSVLVLRGQGTLTLDGVALPLKAGDMVFIRHDRVHWFAATGGEVAVAIAIFTPPLDAPDSVPVDSPGSGG